MRTLFTNPKQYAVFLLVSIIIIASFLRLYNIDGTPPGLYPDEAMNGNNALEALATGQFKTFYPENNGREGFFINIQALSIMTFGNEPWALRGVSAIFGILTVLGMYFLTRELFLPTGETHKDEALGAGLKRHEKIALLATFLIATSFWHINFSRIGFRAIMAPFFATWGIYLTVLITRKLREFMFRKQASQTKLELGAPNVFAIPQEKTYWGLNLYTILCAGSAGFIFGLGFNSYIAYRVMPLIPLAMFIYWFITMRDSRKELIKILVLFSAFAFLAILPLAWHIVANPQDFLGRTSQISIFSMPNPIFELIINIGKTIGMFFAQGDLNWRHNLSGRAELFWPVGIMFLIGIITAIHAFWDFIIRIIKKTPLEESSHELAGQFAPPTETASPIALLVPFLWLLTAMLPVVISAEGIPHALRAILMIPPVFILSAVGGIWIYDHIIAFARGADPESTWSHVKEILAKVLVVIFLILLITEAYFMYFVRWGKDPNTYGAFAQQYVDLGREINNLPIDMPKYILVKGGGTDVRGLPMSTQTVMFITDSFTPEKQIMRNIHYVLPEHERDIPEGAKIIIID